MSPNRTDTSSTTAVTFGRGVISRDIFTRTEIYEEELERVFARSWLFVGHESQITNPGDFILSRTGEESVILNRDEKGRIHVFLNNCRHRGDEGVPIRPGQHQAVLLPVSCVDLRR